MKKIIPIFLALVLAVSSTACSPKVPEISQETMFFQNTEWGMSKADTLKTLKLSEKDLTLVEQDRFETDVFKVADYNYNGKKCDLFLHFASDKQTLQPIIPTGSFHKVTLKTTDISLIESELKKFDSLFTDKVNGTYPLGIAGSKVSWISTKTVKDYVVDNNLSVADILYINPENRPETIELTEEEMLEKLDTEFANLSKIDASVYLKSDNDGYVGEINFTGDIYALVSTHKK